MVTGVTGQSVPVTSVAPRSLVRLGGSRSSGCHARGLLLLGGRDRLPRYVVEPGRPFLRGVICGR